MKPVTPEIIRLSRERQTARMKLRPGWLCPLCGSAHGPNVETCPNDGKPPKREVIR